MMVMMSDDGNHPTKCDRAGGSIYPLLLLLLLACDHGHLSCVYTVSNPSCRLDGILGDGYKIIIISPLFEEADTSWTKVAT